MSVRLLGNRGETTRRVAKAGVVAMPATVAAALPSLPPANNNNIDLWWPSSPHQDRADGTWHLIVQIVLSANQRWSTTQMQ